MKTFPFEPGQSLRLKATPWTRKHPHRGASYGGGEDRYIHAGETGTLELVHGNGWDALNLVFSRGRFVPFGTYYSGPFDGDGLPCRREDATRLETLSVDLADWSKVKTPARHD